MANQRRRRDFLDFLTSETSFFNGFLSTLMSNPEKKIHPRRKFPYQENTTLRTYLKKFPAGLSYCASIRQSRFSTRWGGLTQ